MTSIRGASRGAATFPALLMTGFVVMTIVAVVLGILYAGAKSNANQGKRPITVEWAIPNNLTEPEDFIQVERGEKIEVWNNTLNPVVLNLSYGEFEPHPSGLTISLAKDERTTLIVAKQGGPVTDQTKLHFEWDDDAGTHPGSGVIIVRGP